MYRIGSAGNAGKGLFATQALPPGTTIFSIERPLVLALDTPALDYTCEWCLDGVGEAALGPGGGETDGEVQLQRCSNCKLVKYCSKPCQVQAWKHHHKLECKIFAALVPRVLPNAVRILLQLLLRRRKGSLPEDSWKSFTALTSHIQDFHHSPKANKDARQKLQMTAMAAKQYGAGPEPMPYYEELAAKIYINTQTLVSPIFHPLGLCLDPLAASVNHSCRPNAVVVFDGARMLLRATSAISSGDEINISYIDPTFSPSRRQAELAGRYFFECRCVDCSAGHSFGLPYVPAANSKAQKAIEALNALDATAQMCLEAAEAALVSPGPGSPTGGDDEDPDGGGQQTHYLHLCEGLAVYLSQGGQALASAYPTGRQPLARLRFDATVELLARGHFVPALILSLQNYYDSDPAHFPHPAHPVRAVHVYVLSKLAGQIGFVILQGQDADAAAFAQAFGMDDGRRLGQQQQQQQQQGQTPAITSSVASTTWPEVSMALLGEAAACIHAGHPQGGRLDEQCQAERRAAAGAGSLVPPEAKALLDQSLDAGESALGIRDPKRWQAPRRVAAEGWDWYAAYVRDKSAGREIDPGIGILVAPRSKNAPALVVP